jgi:hypothetical protein
MRRTGWRTGGGGGQYFRSETTKIIVTSTRLYIKNLRFKKKKLKSNKAGEQNAYWESIRLDQIEFYEKLYISYIQQQISWICCDLRHSFLDLI